MIDPAARKVLRREQLAGNRDGRGRAGGRVLTLLARRDGIGPVQLAVIGGDGSVRTVADPRGSPPARPRPPPRRRPVRLARTGRARARAIVVGRESLVAVDLETLAVREQDSTSRTSARARRSSRAGGGARSGCVGARLRTRAGAPTGRSLRPRRPGRRRRLGRDPRARREGELDAARGSTLLAPARSAATGSTGRCAMSCSPAPTPATSRSRALRVRRQRQQHALRRRRRQAGRIVGLARTAKPTVVLAPRW